MVILEPGPFDLTGMEEEGSETSFEEREVTTRESRRIKWHCLTFRYYESAPSTRWSVRSSLRPSPD